MPAQHDGSQDDIVSTIDAMDRRGKWSLFTISASIVLHSASCPAISEVKTTWAGNQVGECLSRNFIRVPGETICIREVTGNELKRYYHQRRLTAFKNLEEQADNRYKQYDRLVEQGYDSDVPLKEFRRRLDKISEAQEEKRKMQRKIRDMQVLPFAIID